MGTFLKRFQGPDGRGAAGMTSPFMSALRIIGRSGYRPRWVESRQAVRCTRRDRTIRGRCWLSAFCCASRVRFTRVTNSGGFESVVVLFRAWRPSISITVTASCSPDGYRGHAEAGLHSSSSQTPHEQRAQPQHSG